MKHKKVYYRIILFSLLFLTILGVVGILTQYILNNKIKDLFIQELNKQLVTKVQVEHVKLSLFKDFPYASVRFTGVKLEESGNHIKKGQLLNAEVISLRFGLPDIFRNRFTVTNVLVKGAVLNIHIFSDGTDNYHFWKKSNKKTTEFTFDVQQISVLNTRFEYVDEAAKVTCRFHFAEAAIKGKFAEQNFLLKAKGKTAIEQISSGTITYVSQRKSEFDISMDVINREGLYKINKSMIQTSDLQLTASGWIISRDDRQELNLKISTTEAPLNDLISAFPEKYHKKLNGYQYGGNASLSVDIKGPFAGNQVPSVRAELKLKNGLIARSNTNVKLENVNLNAVYEAGPGRQDERLNITGLQARFKNGYLSGNLLMKGLKSPEITVSVKADIDLAEARELLNIDTIQSLKGRLILDSQFEGKLADINQPSIEDLKKCQWRGKAEIRQGDLGLKGFDKPIERVNTRMTFNNNDLRLSALSFHIGKSDFTSSGTVENLMAWILLKNQKIAVTGKVVSDRMDWDELSETNSTNGEYNFQLPIDINIEKLQMSVANFTFRKFSSSGFSAQLQLHNRILVVSNIIMKSMQGIVSGQVSLNASSGKYTLIQCKTTFSRVNVKNLFAEFGNFGNTDLTSENLEGLVTADLVFAASMLPNLEIDMQSVKTHANIRIENGRLVNYAPMLGLSKFLRVEDLSDIRFETMQNQVDIANRIVYIPNMQIKSSAIDLNLMGTHTFNNELDYHFSIALTDLLAAKFHTRNPTYEKQSAFGPIEDDGRGRSKVYVSMTGTVDNPVFSYDKKAVREKISTEMKNQKAELKEAFRKEFNQFQADTLKKSQNQKEKAIQKKQEEGKFVIEWDDDKKLE